MTQQNPRELLKQGDPQAIASSINRTLKPKGINAEVTRDNGCLHITLESGKVPDQMVLVDFIRTGMTKLGLESIHTVQVYGRRIGDSSPTWEEEIELMPASPMLYEHETSMPHDSVGLDDVERESEDYYQDEEFDRDEDDEVEDEVEETPPPKKQFPKWAIPVGILVPVMALAGLFFTGNLPFLSGSTSEPTSPEVASPSPTATSSTPKPASPSPSASDGEKPAASPAPTAIPNAAAKPASPAPLGASPAPTAASGTPKASPAPAAASGTPKASPAPAAASGTPKASPAPTAASGTPKASPAPTAASGTPKAASGTPKSDPWREAVNQAQSAAILAQTAQSQTEWIAVANQWQKAVDLMNVVPTTSPNHQKAQQKAAEYKSNLVVANRRAAAAP
ncbi:hypothetical protein [Microcoleus sp.]|uniref:hypothetical protein n=1 Tax=Microcoleus sp. TaxID=44472 RepID=UPI003524F598